MMQKIQLIGNMCQKIAEFKRLEIKELFNSALKEITSKVDNYIGDYPTFIEPVFLDQNVEIGDDVLLGPSVFIGKNCVIGDYVEISNSIILDDVKIGENFKLENCIVCKNSKLDFSKFTADNSMIIGSGTSHEQIKIIKI